MEVIGSVPRKHHDNDNVCTIHRNVVCVCVCDSFLSFRLPLTLSTDIFFSFFGTKPSIVYQINLTCVPCTPSHLQKIPLRDSRVPWFYTYGFDLSDRSCRVSIVLVLIVVCLYGCVFTTILTVTPYILFYMYHFPKWHMMSVHFENFTGLLCIIVLTWHFSPGFRLFFIRM